MIDQKALDDIADRLVEAGIRVTYGNLRDAFLEQSVAINGAALATSHSMRDIQDPFDDWKRRRRYKPHLATHDLPERAEKAVADALDALRVAADRLPANTPPMAPVCDLDAVLVRVEDILGGIDRRLEALSAENAALRRDVAILAAARQQSPRAIRKGRKAGVFDSTSRHFWNRLMLMFRAHIKAEGPKPWNDLFALVDDDSHALAAAAFEPINETTLKEKLRIRVGHQNYFRLEGDLYHLLPTVPKKRKAKARAKPPGKPGAAAEVMGHA